MKTIVKILCFLALAIPAFAQTTVQVTPAVAVVAGQSACLGQYQGSVQGFVPCDNTAASPAGAVGVFITAGHPQTRGVPGSAVQATIAYNGVFTVPFLATGSGGCAAGELVGDIDGSGDLNAMGYPGTTSDLYAESYVGYCVGMNAALTQMTLFIQPGYVFDPPATGDSGRRRR